MGFFSGFSPDQNFLVCDCTHCTLASYTSDPATKVRGSIFRIFGSQVSLRVTTMREMKYTHYFDITMGNKIALHHECCFPKCTKSW